MKRYLIGAVFLTLVSILIIYPKTDMYMKKTLTSNVWENNRLTMISKEIQDNDLLDGIDINEVIEVNNIKFLSSGVYIKQAQMIIVKKDNLRNTKIVISENGTWSVEGGYLIMTMDYYDSTSYPENDSKEDRTKDFILDMYINDSKFARKISPINHKALLLTSLNQRNELFYSN